MMELLRVLAVFLSVSPALAIPPESFGFPSAPNDTMLTVTFPGHDVVSEGELLGIEFPKDEPNLAVDPKQYRSIATYTGQYMAIMVDPDAMTPQNPSERFYLHWAQPNMTSDNKGKLSNATAAWVPYTRPAPPPTSDPHRYIVYAFDQPANFTVPSAFSKFSASNRGNFNLTEFISQASLGQPAAANYFFVENRTQVPANFSAPATSSFPGGNGGAITDGPGPVVMPSTSMPASSATGSASATAASASASSTGAAGKVDVARGANVILAAVGAYAFWAL